MQNHRRQEAELRKLQEQVQQEEEDCYEALKLLVAFLPLIMMITLMVILHIGGQ